MLLVELQLVGRHHDHGSSYKKKHLIEGCLTVSEGYYSSMIVGSLMAGMASVVLEFVRALIHKQREIGLGMDF